jgi:hypothetical protein
MRYIVLLITALLLSGCYYGYDYYPYGYYGYWYGGYPYYGPYVAQQPYYGPSPYYGGSTGSSYTPPAALDPNNCGTPDEPKPCNRRLQ